MKTNVVSAKEWEAARQQMLREGEGRNARPGRAGCGAPADAVDGRGEEL